MRRTLIGRVVALVPVCLFVVLSTAEVAEAGLTFTLRSTVSGIGFEAGFEEVHCGGSANISPAKNQLTVGVSYVCQWSRVGSGVWTTHGTAPASTCNDCTGTDYHRDRWPFPCDAGNDLLIRARVDGWYIDTSGVRHDTAAVTSSSIRVLCSAVGAPASVGELRAIFSVHGSTAGSGPSVSCGGSNTMDPMRIVEDILVSYVCQKAPEGTSSWVNIGTPPQHREFGAMGTGYDETDIDCGNLGTGRWYVRARADGWWEPYGGARVEQDIVSTISTTIIC